MNIDPSGIIYYQWGFVRITATLVFTWVTMLLLFISSYMITRNLSENDNVSKGQNILEAMIETISRQIYEISRQDPEAFLPFVATLFIFILFSNILSVIPGFISPTGSLNTTAALALCVFAAVPSFGIASRGLLNYLKQYTKPSPFMLPFNIIGEISRVISLAVRLYGNVMSSGIIVAILLGVIPLFFPVIIQLLGLLTGTIQAYIFAVLAIVYISAAIKKETPDQ